jgi:dTDP-4-amino-4,6-dideoxy-D-galactose acyltransferase
MNSFEFLHWDSDFFGYRVAKVTINEKDPDNYKRTLSILHNEHIRLTYILLSPEASDLNDVIIESGGQLVDKKVTFCKSSTSHSGFRNEILEYSGNGEKKELYELALQAGLFSRFRIDNNFKNGEYERLYKKWLDNSLNGNVASKVIIARTKEHITGLITLGVKGTIADIGLLAVDRTYTGMGIGSELVYYADNEAYAGGYNKIKVVTQLDNERACALYKRCGFDVESLINIYHLWL